VNPSYDLFQQAAQNNKQLYTLLKFACRCDHVSSFIMNTYESGVAFLTAKPNTIRMYGIATIDESNKQTLTNIAKELEVDFKLDALTDTIEPTDLLYINTPAEGNYRAMELGKYADQVRKYILLPNTVVNAHQASNNIKLNDGINPIGLVFGINHFLQAKDNWFILEHDDITPGMTVLINRDNCNG
jgi:hypothetical protein